MFKPHIRIKNNLFYVHLNYISMKHILNMEALKFSSNRQGLALVVIGDGGRYHTNIR